MFDHAGARAVVALLMKGLTMAHLHVGDVVIAVPIGDCSIGHPDWHRDFANPEMNRKSYMVTWSGFSAYWQRPIIGVAGRAGHFCAGCFVKQKPADDRSEDRIVERRADRGVKIFAEAR